MWQSSPVNRERSSSAQATHLPRASRTLRNKCYSASSVRVHRAGLRPEPRPTLQLTALRRLRTPSPPGAPSRSFLPRSPTRSLGPPFTRPFPAPASAGPAGLAERPSGRTGGGPPPLAPPGRGSLRQAPGPNHRERPKASQSIPRIAPRTSDSDPNSQLTARPEAGRRKPRFPAPPTGRPGPDPA